MKRPAPFVAGIAIALLGIVFTLQGVGVISGSTMSNTTTWSVLGPIIAIVGVMLVVRGARRTATTARPNEGGL
jgi:uncharacterized membrane protein YidH (DUF202 family)